MTIRFAARRGSSPSRRRSILTSITTVLCRRGGARRRRRSRRRQAGGEDVELQLDRREVVAGRDAAEGRPGGDGVPERGPDPAVDEAARVQVPPVDDDAAPRMRVLDLQRLDPEVAGEAAGQERPDALRRDRRARVRRGVAHRNGSPSARGAKNQTCTLARSGLIAGDPSRPRAARVPSSRAGRRRAPAAGPAAVGAPQPRPLARVVAVLVDVPVGAAAVPDGALPGPRATRGRSARQPHVAPRSGSAPARSSAPRAAMTWLDPGLDRVDHRAGAAIGVRPIEEEHVRGSRGR